MPKCDFNNIEIALWHGCSPVNMLHIFRIPLLKNTPERLLLYICLFFSVCLCLTLYTSLSLSLYLYFSVSLYLSLHFTLSISVSLSLSFCMSHSLNLSLSLCLSLSFNVSFCQCLFLLLSSNKYTITLLCPPPSLAEYVLFVCLTV